jgi:hypothetical protein
MTNETMTIKVINLEPTLEFLNEELEEAIADNLPTWQCTLKKQIARLKEIKEGVISISSLSDFSEVIEERKRYYAETVSYQMVAGDVRDCKWLTNIKESKTAIVVMEGVSMYLTVDEMRSLTDSLCAHFEKLALLVDCYTSFAAKMSKQRNPINDVGVTEVYGIDHPKAYQNGELTFVKEHAMIPKKYIDKLKGFERFVFAKLYAGGFSKKLYRLYEYQKK